MARHTATHHTHLPSSMANRETTWKSRVHPCLLNIESMSICEDPLEQWLLLRVSSPLNVSSWSQVSADHCKQYLESRLPKLWTTYILHYLLVDQPEMNGSYLIRKAPPATLGEAFLCLCRSWNIQDLPHFFSSSVVFLNSILILQVNPNIVHTSATLRNDREIISALLQKNKMQSDLQALVSVDTWYTLD